MARGTLRIYLGAAPGVGKTFAMLEEAHRRLARGTDVVVGFVEHHHRPATVALLEGLEVLPRAEVTYRGTVFTELDVRAVLDRRPAVVLIDELAHTNVPGSEHAKRWQDVQQVLDAGISVITTVNIQHLESLNDVTEQITGVRQRETVPDHVVRAADQIELADMSPQALRRRLAHGNVYAADKVDAALGNYFREGNLTALRELSLLWLADRVDEGMERYRRQHEIDATWATRERIVVPVTGGGESATLMRRAARIASRGAGGEWRALYVTQQTGLTGVSPARLEEMRTKAEELGGTFHSVVGDDVAEAILDFARAENATQVIVGASRRGGLASVWRPGIGERVIAESGEIDVHVVTHDFAGTNTRAYRMRTEVLGRRRLLLSYVFALVMPLLVGAALWATEGLHGLPTESLLLMVVVVASALIGGLVPASLAAVLSGLVLNVLFTPPRYTLTISDPENALTIVLFVVVGIAVASVVDLAARRLAQAQRARAEADALTVLAHSLVTSGGDLTGLLSSACEVLGASGAEIVDASGVLAGCGSTDDTDDPVVLDLGDDTWLRVAAAHPAASQRGLMKAYAAAATVMLERRRAVAGDLERLRLAEADRTRTALLAAVSHDLRSPLAAVRAAVDGLRTPGLTWSPEDTDALLETIDDGTTRLTLLVSNLLDMSRISAGAVTVTPTTTAVGPAVRGALAPIDGADRIEVRLDESLVACVDPGLFDRVVANIAENALKYTPADAAIRIDGAADGDRVVLRVVDGGPGVGDHDRDRLFVPFQRLGDVPERDGVGLGLAVARGFTEAMDGTIATEDTPGGGLTFVLDLPSGISSP